MRGGNLLHKVRGDCVRMHVRMPGKSGGPAALCVRQHGAGGYSWQHPSPHCAVQPALQTRQVLPCTARLPADSAAWPDAPLQVYKQMVAKGKCLYTSNEALSWMIDVAGGMCYLHAQQEGKPVVIHRCGARTHARLCLN